MFLNARKKTIPYISSVQGLINHTKPKHQRQAFPVEQLQNYDLIKQ